MNPRYGPFLVISAGLGVTAALAAQVFRAPEPNGTEKLLFEKLDHAISGNPPRAEDVVNAFNLDEKCARQTCFFEGGEIAGLSYEKGNIRPSEEGMIFVLERFDGTCVRFDRVESHFRTGRPEESCAHGGCWYRTAQHKWGIIGFGINDPNDQCVSSVVINTQPYQRPRGNQ